MSLALSSNDADVISRELSGEIKDKTPCNKVFGVYEIQSSIDHINKHSKSRVALQFPDYLLPDSVQVVNELKKKTNADFLFLLIQLMEA